MRRVYVVSGVLPHIMRRVIFGITPTFAKHVPSCPILIWIPVPHMSVGCCFWVSMLWNRVENHIIFDETHHQYLKLGHSIIQPHPDILRRSRPSISSSDCCLVHGCTDTCVVVGRGEWGKSLLQYGYIMMCIDFWRQTAGPTVVTNAANVCRRLMRNGWWQCCTQVASLL